MKKFLALLLACVMTLALLAGCGRSALRPAFSQGMPAHPEALYPFTAPTVRPEMK